MEEENPALKAQKEHEIARAQKEALNQFLVQKGLQDLQFKEISQKEIEKKDREQKEKISDRLQDLEQRILFTKDEEEERRKLKKEFLKKVRSKKDDEYDKARWEIRAFFRIDIEDLPPEQIAGWVETLLAYKKETIKMTEIGVSNALARLFKK